MVFIMGVAGCGSGSGNGSAPKQQKTATITFSTVSSAHSAPLEGIQIASKLPSGASISNISTALTGHNDAGLVGLKYYTLNPSIVSFIVQPTGTEPIKFGTFAELKCDIAPGVTLDQSSFSVSNADIQMTGKDQTGTTVDLVNQIPVTLSVSFGY
jgi:hypothetical protein